MIQTTIITPTIGDDPLVDACQSVADQVMPALHLIVIDGQENYDRTMELVMAVSMDNPSTYEHHILTLPYNVGSGGNYGHLVYAGVPSFVQTPFFSFLDQDNYLAHDWTHKMQQALDRNEQSQYVTCRRTIVKDNKDVVGKDNFESIGENDLGYRLYDTNTWMFRRNMALLTPYISLPYHKGAEGSWGGDRSLTDTLWEIPHSHLDDYHGTHYRAPERLIPFFEENCND